MKGSLFPQVRVLLRYARALAGDYQGAIVDAEEAVRLAAEHWQIPYNAACIYGLASGIAQIEYNDPQTASRCADRAMELLAKAVEGGLKDAVRTKLANKDLIAKDREFVSLRKRKDFKELLELARGWQ